MKKVKTPSTSCFIQPDDLSALTLISAAKVKAFVKALNAVTDKKLAGRKLVAAVGTGGTIAMKVEKGIRLPNLNFASVFAKCNPDLQERFFVVSLDAFSIDSADMDYRHVRDLAIALTYVWRNLTRPIAGFLILHGSDTLPYTSAAMSLMMGQGLPFSIVYTASQRTLEEPLNDVAVNLRNALFTLEALHKKDMAEVVIVVGDHAMLATSSVKVDDLMENAFDAPIHKYVASFNRLEYPVRLAGWLNPRRKGVKFEPTIWAHNFARTLLVTSTLGLNPTMVGRWVSAPEIQAVLWYSYGTGTVYKQVGYEMLKVARARNLPIFIASPVNGEYKVAYESGQKMVEMGVIPIDMTLPAALAKIEIALGKFGDDVAEVARFVTTNYVGEIPSAESRYVPLK
ncbi:MAG: asparaginase domain-containing protein [Alphaproteobacteria bacterium]